MLDKTFNATRGTFNLMNQNDRPSTVLRLDPNNNPPLTPHKNNHNQNNRHQSNKINDMYGAGEPMEDQSYITVAAGGGRVSRMNGTIGKNGTYCQIKEVKVPGGGNSSSIVPEDDQIYNND